MKKSRRSIRVLVKDAIFWEMRTQKLKKTNLNCDYHAYRYMHLIGLSQVHQYLPAALELSPSNTNLFKLNNGIGREGLCSCG